VALIPNDSPLRRVPTKLDRRTILYLDGVRFSFESFDLASLRLATTLDQLARLRDDNTDLNSLIVSATTDAWSMIDAAHRLRELLQQLPGLKKNQPELQLFLRRTAPVEDLRHFFQHFRTEIQAFAERSNMPLCETLSWAWTDPANGQLENHTIIPGTYFERAEVSTCTFDTQRFKFVERVLLNAGPCKLDLADLNEHVQNFCAWYLAWFLHSFENLDHSAADVHLKLRVRPVIRSDPDPPVAPDAA